MPDPKDTGRSAIDPKDTGRDDTDPKDTGRDDTDPKDTGRGVGETPFGMGGGWVVVAFLSPVGMSVPDLAIQMLGGSGGQRRLPGLSRTPLTDAAVIARNKAREQLRIREEESRRLREFEAQKAGRTPPQRT